MSDIFFDESFSTMNRKINGHTGDFMKRQAKKIAKEQNIPHHQALEKAAINAGFTNWNHFVNASKKTPLPMQNRKTKVLQLNPLGTAGLVAPPKKINPYRNLLIAAINVLLKNDLISLKDQGKVLPDEERGYHFVQLLGFPSVILWQDIGFEELRISVWWKYDHSMHPQVNLTANARESFDGSSPLANRVHYKNFVGVVASVWLERRTGKYIQGKNNEAIFDVYTRSGEKAALEKLPLQKPEGFKIEGKFYI
jgi:hypothetical protein